MSATSIEWATHTWNPTTGCTRVSAGCDHCYAVGQSHRVAACAAGRGDSKTLERYHGLTVLNNRGDRHFNGEVRCHEDRLAEAQKFPAGARVFVNSMSDLFHKGVPFEFIDRVMATVALRPDVVFMVLTKRPARMREYFSSGRLMDMSDQPEVREARNRVYNDDLPNESDASLALTRKLALEGLPALCEAEESGVVRNLWLGVSAEDQAAADARIPDLLATPAAVRFVSYEPALGPVDFWGEEGDWLLPHPLPNGNPARPWINKHADRDARCSDCEAGALGPLDWIIVGGESGRRARPFDLAWARRTVEQCKAAGVACFVKQLGARPMAGGPADDEPGGWFERFLNSGVDYELVFKPGADPEARFRLRDTKGGDVDEWPEDLRVQEFPAVEAPGAGGA